MGADANIFQQYLQPIKSVADYGADLDKRDLLKVQLAGAQRQNALADLTVQTQQQQAAQALAKQNALQAIYNDPTIKTPVDRENAMLSHPLLMDIGQSAQKARLDAEHVAAQTDQQKALAGKTQQESADAAVKRYRGSLDFIDTPEGAARWMQAQYADPVLGAHMQAMGPIQDAISRIPTDPQAFNQWRQQAAMGMDAYQKKLQADQQIAETGRHNKAEEGISVSNNAATNATSRANNAATIGKDLLVAGIDNKGQPIGGTMDSLVDMLGQNRLNPTLALQRLTAPQRANIVSQVQAKYPGWDETTYDAKKGAALKFTAGDLGNALRSVSTANAHLDQLGELADAMKNGNTPIVNKVQNWFSTQAGLPNVTNFDAIKAIVGQEVVKAIVAGGGTGGERDEAKAAFDNAKSPAQLKGAIEHYRAVMGAQAQNLLAQRDAAGLPRSTLPNYTAGATNASKVVNFSDLK